jgi:hypothetical protein
MIADFIYLLLVILSIPSCSVATVSHKPSMVADWVRAKLGQTITQPKLWMYKGSLYDPLDGRKIANIQGVECISFWNSTDGAPKLKVDSLLENPNATFDDTITLKVAKVFCYTTLDEENPELLRHIRVRPHSPRKYIPLNQASHVWETATTYISRGKDFLVHSEWPNGQHLWAQTKSSNKSKKRDSANNNIEFTVFTKRRSPQSRLYMPNLIAPPTRNDSNETIISPKRSALIQFGSSSMESKNKFGARETYSFFTFQSTEISKQQPWWLSWRRGRVQPASSDCNRLKYTRYGEGPPFYAPGRMCMLEMQGETIETLKGATPLLRQIIEDQIENFPAVSADSSFGNLRLIPENPTPETKWGRQKQNAMQLYERLRAATRSLPAGSDLKQLIL